MQDRDHLDFIREQWHQEKPELDTRAMGLIGRLYRLNHFMRIAVEESHKAFGLRPGEFDVLATLRRSGEPCKMTPTALFQAAMLTSGAMTNRLNRLEQAGLISREADPADRRSLLVVLTPLGREKIDAAIIDHVDNLQRLAALMKPEEIEQLDGLLKSWLAHFEQ